MTTLVMAHGGRDPQAAELKVPPGMRIDFYADFDENMFFHNGLAVVVRGGLGTPNQSYAPDEAIPNYIYSALSSDQLGWYLQLDRTGLPAWFVGDDLPGDTALCTDHATCDAAGANDGSGTHTCDGVLGRAQSEGENHLVILACRGNIEQANEATKALRGADGQADDSYNTELQEEADRFTALDEAGKEATWAGYPENTKLTFMVYPNIKAWADARGAKQLLASDGPIAFATYYATLDAATKAVLDAQPDTAIELWAGSALTYFKDDIASFPAWFDTLEEVNRTKLLTDPGVYAWHQGRGAGAAAAAASAAPARPTISQDDIDAADERNRLFVKGLAPDTATPWAVGSFAVLLGSGHDNAAAVALQRDYATGTFQVKRATIGAGRIVFSGAPPVHQATITAAVGRSSDKSVRFE
jgi:hypothetical protein